MRNIAVLLLASLAGLGPVRAVAAPVAAVQSTNGPSFAWRDIIGANQSATTGWSFVVGPLDLELDALGFFDLGADGLETSHPVGIWTATGTLLDQVTMPAGTAATLVGSYRYEAVAPLILHAGQTYVLGAYMATVIDRCGSACGDPMLVFGSETYAPGLTFSLSRQNRAIIGNGSLAFPDLDAEIAEAFFGPNFLLTAADPVSAPEPSTLGLGGLAASVLFAGVFRRDKQRSV